MYKSQNDFQRRIKKVSRKHHSMARGYTADIRRDGLIVVRPRRRIGHGFPLSGLLGLLLGFFIFKAVMLAALGDITYNERVAKLSNGTMLEQGGAWVMQLDPLTVFFAGFLDPFVK